MPRGAAADEQRCFCLMREGNDGDFPGVFLCVRSDDLQPHPRPSPPAMYDGGWRVTTLCRRPSAAADVADESASLLEWPTNMDMGTVDMAVAEGRLPQAQVLSGSAQRQGERGGSPAYLSSPAPPALACSLGLGGPLGSMSQNDFSAMKSMRGGGGGAASTSSSSVSSWSCSELWID